ncbi:hypothetical protein AVEN_200495-1, partial [Araneus ventricosus]
APPVRDIGTLNAGITDAVSGVQMLGNTWRELEYHFDILRATKR